MHFLFYVCCFGEKRNIDEISCKFYIKKFKLKISQCIGVFTPETNQTKIALKKITTFVDNKADV